jgi:hypothetical protein
MAVTDSAAAASLRAEEQAQQRALPAEPARSPR